MDELDKEMILEFMDKVGTAFLHLEEWIVLAGSKIRELEYEIEKLKRSHDVNGSREERSTQVD